LRTLLGVVFEAASRRVREIVDLRSL
jgi:hypothetical protein